MYGTQRGRGIRGNHANSASSLYNRAVMRLCRQSQTATACIFYLGAAFCIRHAALCFIVRDVGLGNVLNLGQVYNSAVAWRELRNVYVYSR